jgi:hypothetical protein
MEIILVVIAVMVLAMAFAYSHHTRKGQSMVSEHRLGEESDATAPGAAGPAEIDRDRGDYPVYDRGTT